MNALVISAFLAAATSAFYIPGINPIAYRDGDVVNIYVNGLHSLSNIVPYDYYDGPFCRPNELKARHETIGEMLSGDNIKSSPYSVNMGLDSGCEVLTCQPAETSLTKAKIDRLEQLIENNYRGFMVIDNLPAFNNGSLMYQGKCVKSVENYLFLRGYAIGVPKACTGGDTLVNNHLEFRIQYHRLEGSEKMGVDLDFEKGGLVEGEKKKSDKKKKKSKSGQEDDTFLVVGVTVEPFSVKWEVSGVDLTVPMCTDDFNPRSPSVKPLRLSDLLGNKIAWTYSVSWVEEPNIHWASRWDSYLHTSVADINDRIHWLSIINTVLIVICLSSMVILVIVRALKKDLAKYNAVFELSKEEQLEAQKEEGGWKVIHGDVFRTPKRPELLTILSASGMQIFAMVSSTLFVALLGFLSPANRGGLMSALLLLFVLQAFIAGYFAARMYLKLGGERSWILIFKVGVFVPAIIFTIFLSVNVILRTAHSSGAVPLPSLLVLLALWLFVSIPLAIVGASFGFRVVPGQHARKVNTIPRPIDPSLQPWYLDDRVVLLAAGLVPFAALFLELKFILASLWQGMVYYVFGFLAVVFILWSVTVALTSTVVVYYRLCAENYHWWWLSFLAPTSMGIHLYSFFIYYFYTSLTIRSNAATAIYFLYMALATIFYVLCGGAVGFLSTWGFVHITYSSVKID